MRLDKNPFLKLRYKSLGLTIVDLSKLFRESIPAINHRLNGFLPLTDERREKWLKILDKVERERVAA